MLDKERAKDKAGREILTRQKHLEWCKKRAIAYIDAGDTQLAYASIVSDLRNHPETSRHQGISLGMMLLMTGKLESSEEMRKFINGFR